MHHRDDLAPRVRNHFRPSEYFSYNIRNGVRRSPSGTRIITLPEDFLRGVQEALEDETGAAAPIVLYSCGRWWGRQFVRRLFEEIRQFYKLDAGSIPAGVFLQILRSVWSLYGWGRLDIDFELRDSGFVEASVENAFYGQVVGTSEVASEQLLAGVLAAIVSELAGRELECAQTTCMSKGDARATFLIGLKSRVEVINTWVKQGKSHGTVRESIASGQLA